MKRIISYLFLFAFILFVVSCRQGEKPVSPEDVGMSSDTLAYADERMQSYIDEGKLAGIAVRTAFRRIF